MILSVWAETTTLHVLRNHVTFLPGGPRRRDRAHYIEDGTLYVIGLFPHVAIKLRRRSTVPKLYPVRGRGKNSDAFYDTVQ